MRCLQVVPHADYPLRRVGTIVLNCPVDNAFAESEQVAFSPGNLIPGVEALVDKVLQARLLFVSAPGAAHGCPTV